MTDILLEMKGICKEFPGVKALNNVSLTVHRGTVHALMGENGAGKSTLMKCLFGIYNKDSGEIFLDGKPVSFKNQTVVRFIRASVRLPPKAPQPLPGGSSSAYIPRRAHDRRRRIFRKVPTRPLPRPCAPTLSTYLLRFP